MNLKLKIVISTHKIDNINLLEEIFKREHINKLLNISF